MAYSDYNNSMNAYMKRRWEARRKQAVEYLGGKCARCDRTTDLHFDHIDPKNKIMTIARASSRSEEFFWNEVSKCQLLCTGHHHIKTGEDYLAGVYQKA